MTCESAIQFNAVTNRSRSPSWSSLSSSVVPSSTTAQQPVEQDESLAKQYAEAPKELIQEDQARGEPVFDKEAAGILHELEEVESPPGRPVACAHHSVPAATQASTNARPPPVGSP
eukprot:3262594-Prymnesium_polylepis.1